MKISLSHERGVEVLSVSEGLADHEAKILTAGLRKILLTGKNKIVIDLGGLSPTPDLSTGVMREIAAFDMLARELSGRIVLGGVSAPLKTKIEAFAKPPVILCFDTRKQAIDFLVAPPEAAKPAIPPPVPTAIPATPAPTAAPPAAASAGDGGDAEAQLRARVRDLERENASLREQVVLATIARRPPASEEAYDEKIAFLEAKVEKLVIDASAAAPAAKK